MTVAISMTYTLQNQQLAVDTQTRRMDASVSLIQARSGGWDRSVRTNFLPGTYCAELRVRIVSGLEDSHLKVLVRSTLMGVFLGSYFGTVMHAGAGASARLWRAAAHAVAIPRGASLRFLKRQRINGRVHLGAGTPAGVTGVCLRSASTACNRSSSLSTVAQSSLLALVAFFSFGS